MNESPPPFDGRKVMERASSLINPPFSPVTSNFLAPKSRLHHFSLMSAMLQLSPRHVYVRYKQDALPSVFSPTVAVPGTGTGFASL